MLGIKFVYFLERIWMAVKWIGEINCVWCGSSSRVGIEGDGQGRCFRVICDNGCGAVTQAGRELVVGQKIQALLNSDSVARSGLDRYLA